MSTPQSNANINDSAQSYAAAMAKNLKADMTKVAARVFRSNIVTMRYVFKNGKVAPFLTKNGRDSEYATNVKYEIEELDAEIEGGHPNISSKAEEVQLVMEPVEALKARHFKEFLAQQSASVLKTNDAGSSEQVKLNVANSTTIQEGAAGSDSSAVPATGGLKINVSK